MVKILICVFLGVFTLTHAQEFSDLGGLKNLTDGGRKKIMETLNVINEAPKEYREIIAGRFECLQWECVVQTERVNKSTSETIAKGLSKNKPYKSFDCIVNRSRDVLDKLNSMTQRLPGDSENLLKNGLNVVMPFRLLIPGFNNYVQNLYNTKAEELKGATAEEDKTKILAEVEKKMKLLGTILGEINAKIESSKNQFFEFYVQFVYTAENSLRKIQREGAQNISKCIA